MTSLKTTIQSLVIPCCILGIVLGGSLPGCSNKTPTDPREPTMPTQSIEEVLRAHTDSLMAVAGVVGVGQALCDGAPCIRIYAAKMTSAIEENVPDTLDGYPVDVEVTGPVNARPPDDSG